MSFYLFESNGFSFGWCKLWFSFYSLEKKKLDLKLVQKPSVLHAPNSQIWRGYAAKKNMKRRKKKKLRSTHKRTLNKTKSFMANKFCFLLFFLFDSTSSWFSMHASEHRNRRQSRARFFFILLYSSQPLLFRIHIKWMLMPLLTWTTRLQL